MKKFLYATVAFALSVVGLGFSAPSASASNHADTPFSGVVGYYDEGYTQWRTKTNTTSVYVKNNNIASLRIRGLRPGGTGYGINETLGGSAVVPANTARAIRTNIYERGGRSARIGIRLNASHLNPGRVSGLWSPDSVGKLVNAN